MTSVNKAIILCAKIFAALIIVGIVFSAVSFVGDVSFLFSDEQEYATEKSLTPEGISELDIELEAAELIIQNGDILHVETNSP